MTSRSSRHLACSAHSPFSRVSQIALFGLILTLCGPSRVVPAVEAYAPSDNPHEKPYALIFGTVWGPDDRAVFGIRIKIRKERDTKARWELFSDHGGEFAQRVPAGKEDYVVWADLKGVRSETGKPLHAEEVKVHVDNDERIDISVHLNL